MSSQPATIEVTSGKLEGVKENDIYLFKGIPFAEPPVGALRWMPPQPVKPDRKSVV